jgi:glycosyltransferase involved in cell wall biosynthesis
MYRGAQAVVVPSLAEGFGLPSLEAMACGARVVVSDIPSLREIVGPFGIYVDPEQVDSIAVAIDSAVYSREGDNERVMQVARARSFSWEQVAMRVASKLRE